MGYLDLDHLGWWSMKGGLLLARLLHEALFCESDAKGQHVTSYSSSNPWVRLPIPGAPHAKASGPK